MELEDLSMPHQAILLVEHPVILIRKVQELAGHTLHLKHVEQHETLAYWKSEIEVVVDNEVRCCPVLVVEDWVPSVVG